MSYYKNVVLRCVGTTTALVMAVGFYVLKNFVMYVYAVLMIRIKNCEQKYISAFFFWTSDRFVLTSEYFDWQMTATGCYREHSLIHVRI